jgi:hypothetical protein
MWNKGDIIGLLEQGRVLQKKHKQELEQSNRAKQKLFVEYIMVGKLAQAARLIDNDSVHKVTDDITHVLQEKHPAPIDPDSPGRVVAAE